LSHGHRVYGHAYEAAGRRATALRLPHDSRSRRSQGVARPRRPCRRFLSRSRSRRTRSCLSECACAGVPETPLRVSATSRVPEGTRVSFAFRDGNRKPLAHASRPSPFPKQTERPRGGPVHRGAEVRGGGVQGSRRDERYHHERCVVFLQRDVPSLFRRRRFAPAECRTETLTLLFSPCRRCRHQPRPD